MKLLFFLLLFSVHFIYGQEYNSIRHLKKETNLSEFKNGYWLKKDRKKSTKQWHSANVFNLKVDQGYLKYRTISEIRDFYSWIDIEIKKKGHTVKGIGIAAIVAKQLSILDQRFISFFLVRDKEVIGFANDGSKKVFAFAFPYLKELYFRTTKLKGNAANHWDLERGIEEQCKVLQPLYNNLSNKAFKKLNNMAKGKGVYGLGVPKELRFSGELLDCNDRVKHAIYKVLPYKKQ